MAPARLSGDHQFRQFPALANCEENHRLVHRKLNLPKLYFPLPMKKMTMNAII